MFRTLVKYQDQDEDDDEDDALDDLMLGKVASALQIPPKIKWGSQSGNTFQTLGGDFMKPVIHIGKKTIV